MTSLRKRKETICRALRGRSRLEDQLWDQMRPFGHEFGSFDFERLTEDDRRNARGVFDPALRVKFL